MDRTFQVFSCLSQPFKCVSVSSTIISIQTYNSLSGSALVWADIARKSMRFSDVIAYHVLRYWYTQIEALNRDVGTSSSPVTEILSFFHLTSELFGRLQVHIKVNFALAHRYAIIHTKLGHLLEKVRNEEATVMDVNNYMIDAFPKLLQALNSTT